MEKNMAILIADLSGYTALTETHGSVAAADLIDKYVSITRTCLVGDCKLHENVGDEIMIVSYSADDLVATALMILSNTSNEENFLQIHGGLHYGKVLQRANSYFGSTINLTSRIAAKANAGSLMCSDDFVNALSDKTSFALLSKGSHGFKNITGPKEIFELEVRENKTFHIDPVCRMVVLDTKQAISHPAEPGQYFCSSDCLHIYNHRKENKIN